MPMICVVQGCSNRSNRETTRSYYRIPKVVVHKGEKCKELTEKRRKQWIINLRLGGDASDNARVCSDHFVKGCPSGLNDVKSVDWAPTVNLDCQKLKPTSEAPRRRAKRMKCCADQCRDTEDEDAPQHLHEPVKSLKQKDDSEMLHYKRDTRRRRVKRMKCCADQCGDTEDEETPQHLHEPVKSLKQKDDSEMLHHKQGCSSRLNESEDLAPTVNLDYQEDKPISESSCKQEERMKSEDDQCKDTEGAETLQHLHEPVKCLKQEDDSEMLHYQHGCSSGLNDVKSEDLAPTINLDYQEDKTILESSCKQEERMKSSDDQCKDTEGAETLQHLHEPIKQVKQEDDSEMLHYQQGCSSGLNNVKSEDLAPTVNLDYQEDKTILESSCKQEERMKSSDDQCKDTEGAETLQHLHKPVKSLKQEDDSEMLHYQQDAGCQTDLTMDDIKRMEDVWKQTTTELGDRRTKGRDTQFNQEKNFFVLLPVFQMCEPS